MPPSTAAAVLWFRRDLRLGDHPALLAAADTGRVLPLFVLDPALLHPAGPARRARLAASLRALHEATEGALVVRHATGGSPRAVADAVLAVAAQVGARAVHVSADSGPHGRRRDEVTQQTLQDAGVALVRTGTPYAVGPGVLRTGADRPYQVFTPFRTAWLAHGAPPPAPRRAVRWARTDGEELPEIDGPPPTDLPGEVGALQTWHAFLDGALDGYAQQRDRPDLAGTSMLSAHLKFGEIHPRTLLADLAHAVHERPALARDADVFRSELCWREFYADVLWHQPGSARVYLRPQFARMRHDDPASDPRAAARWQAWRTGRTGYPFVDAGMRQLLAEGWMHNRVRMVTASFLVKHLHLPWQLGARHFMHHLRDGDLASNSHGWQWVAGSGTDAAPYFRVFNPVAQGERFDPDGAYVRRYVPELAHLAGAAAHQPWAHPAGAAHGYPARVIDLAEERREALARYAEVRESAV